MANRNGTLDAPVVYTEARLTNISKGKKTICEPCIERPKLKFCLTYNLCLVSYYYCYVRGAKSWLKSYSVYFKNHPSAITLFLNIAGLQLTSQRPCWMTGTKRSPPLGTKLFYYANSAKTCFIVLSSNMAALSRGCKPRI